MSGLGTSLPTIIQKQTKATQIFDISKQTSLQRYTNSNHKKKPKMFFPNLFLQPIPKWITLNSRSFLVLTNHGPTRKQLYRMGKAGSPNCRYCNQSPEDLDHLLFDCLATKQAKTNLGIQNISGTRDLLDCVEDSSKWEKLLSFVDQAVFHNLDI